MKETNCFLLFLVIMLSLVAVMTISGTLDLKSQVKELEEENKQLQEEKCYFPEKLNPCYLCDEKVKILLFEDEGLFLDGSGKSLSTRIEKFYIQCPNCLLKTDKFESKDELVKYWNKEGADGKVDGKTK